MRRMQVHMVLKLCIIIVVSSVIHGSEEYSASPSLVISSHPPFKGKTPSLGYHGKPLKTIKPSASSLPDGSQVHTPSTPTSASSHVRVPHAKLPFTLPHAKGPVASPHKKFSPKPTMHSTLPGVGPSILSEPALSPISAPPLGIYGKRKGIPAKGSHPIMVRAPHKAWEPFPPESAPSEPLPKSLERKWIPVPASSPSISFYKHHHHHTRKTTKSIAPSYSIPPPTSYHQGHVFPPNPSNPPISSPKRGSPAPLIQHHFPPAIWRSPAPSPSPSLTFPSRQNKRPLLHPAIVPSGSFPKNPKTPVPFQFHPLPPPPPNKDCASIICTEPFTNSPPGSPCGCVWPMQVGLRLSIALYTFFPLVSELAGEISSGVFMKQSQVRIKGANAANEQMKTIVLIDLVPLGEKFDNTTAFLTYEKFWHKQVVLKASLFRNYEVLYVRYPGLPPSPAVAPSSMDTLEGNSYSGRGNDARTVHPLGVDVRKIHKRRDNGSLIAIIVLSSFVAVVLCIGAAWFLLFKRGNHTSLPTSTPLGFIPSFAKQSGAAGSIMYGSGLSSASQSFGSNITTFAGSARTFSANEIERATDNYDTSRVLGEGGFGRVYKGILDDGTYVAVKVLKRDDQQGGREFLAEVEMLSRLHHRNLVKLIGICIEENLRCLVYELIPNGSVESHLHGVDKETAPLDWGARMKVALGAARGLAYLHEDSSPHVIHRDFKSSNILLEHDFNPKVSDFGLARSAVDEGTKHISTRVMGTFGYVAPEYAMTGHLLVKSDVYSYGVVLLELLTGRKPVDMSQPQGQENLVAWARPLLTSKDGLETIIDPDLGPNIPFDSVAKVAAIASMCVQPEVSHRPFMGEVVQALKLVCNECDETREAGLVGSCGPDELLVPDIDARTSTGSGQVGGTSRARSSDFDSSFNTDLRALSASEIFSTSGRFEEQVSWPFARHSCSGPLRTGKGRQFWERLRGLSRGSVSEHGFAFRLWPGSR